MSPVEMRPVDPYAAAERGAAEVERKSLTGLAAVRTARLLWLALGAWLLAAAVAVAATIGVGR